MRIQIPIFSSTISGGQRITFQHAKYLQELGSIVEILIYSTDEEVQFPFVENIKVINVNKKSTFKLFTSIRKMLLISRHINPDSIVFCNSWQTVLIAMMSSAPRKQIVHLIQHDDEIIDSGRPFLKRFFNRVLYLFVYHNKIPKIAVSSWLKNRLKVRYNIDTFLVKNGIIKENFNSNHLVFQNNEEFKILVFARKPKWKGFECVIKALNVLINQGFKFKLIVASNEDVYIPDNLPFEKFVPKSDNELGALFRSSDIFVFPSYAEGFGLPPLEAMSCGIPVICSNCGGVSDFAIDGYNCEMFEPGDFQELARKIIYISENKELASYYKKNGMITADSFQMKDASNQLYQFLKKLEC